jgi:hypothetical protein
MMTLFGEPPGLLFDIIVYTGYAMVAAILLGGLIGLGVAFYHTICKR